MPGLALKADFAAPAHASDIDAGMLGLEDESALRSGWRELERRVQVAAREWIGAIVQRLIELIDSAEGVATELGGFRGSAALDRQALRELVLRFALLLRELPEVVETDLTPVRCMTSGCVVLDMRLRIEHRRPFERVKTW